MWLLSMLGFTYIVIVYIFINYHGHGRTKIDVINVSDKSYLRQKCAC